MPIARQDFTLVPAKPFTIIGKVSDTSGSLIAGATITLAQNSPVPGRIQITTDASGNYSVSLDPGSYNGNYTITASDPGYVSSSITLTIPNGATMTDVADVSATVVSGVVTSQNFLLVEASAVMTGTVSDSDTGRLLSGATVRIGGSSTKTATHGTYTISGIPTGQLQVTVSALRYFTQNTLVQFRDHQTVDMDFAMDSTRKPQDSTSRLP